MHFLRRSRAALPDAPDRPVLSFCERVNAGPASPVHLRRVGPEGTKLGGGVPGAALCGRDLRHGWDLPQQVTDDLVERGAALPPGQPGRTCQDCVAVYRDPACAT